jgi:hypothetical protein
VTIRRVGPGDKPVNPRKSEILTTLMSTALKAVIMSLGLIFELFNQECLGYFPVALKNKMLFFFLEKNSF